jgi:hypothetical protein
LLFTAFQQIGSDMTTPIIRDRSSPHCEIVISIVLKIPIYIEPIVLEAPADACLPSPATISNSSEDAFQSVTLSPAPVQAKEPAKTLPLKTLWFLLLASISAVLVHLLASVSLAKLCPDLSCMRASAPNEQVVGR